MMPVMVKEADLDRIEVPEDYEVLDATALGRRLGFKRDTVLAYLSRRYFRRIPRPNRQIASRLSISEHTAATHVARVLKKVGLNSRLRLATWVTEQGLPSPD